MSADVASGCLGRLWRTWARILAHDLRNEANSALALNGLMLERAGLLDETRLDYLEAQRSDLGSIASWIELTRVCSSRARLETLIASLADYHKNLVVSCKGNLDMVVPIDHLGFALWLLVHGQFYSSGPHRLDVVVTDSALRIAIGLPDAEDQPGRGWKKIGPDTEEGWFGDAVGYLRASGCLVDARHRGDDWCVAITWRR